MNYVDALLCTIVSAKHLNKIFVGSNLDASDPDTKIWFTPSTPSQFGRVCFGFNYKIAENGMNEHGLFIDCNTVPETSWKPDPNKLDWEEWDGWWETGVPDGILSKCKTVNEAITIFESHNLLTFRNMKYLIADATCQSAVLEWSKEGLRIIRRPDDVYFQISTNSFSSEIITGDTICYRHRMAESIFKNNVSVPDVKLIRKILSSTAFEVESPTQVSVIYELDLKRFYVYFFHNFE